MSAFQTAQALQGLRAVLAQLRTEQDRFPDAPLSAAGVFFDRLRPNDPSAYDHWALVARYVGVPAEAIEQVQGVEWSNSWDPTHNGPYFVFLPPTTDTVDDPRREITRQLAAFSRAVRPLVTLLQQLPAHVRGRLPAEPSGWWAVLFHLAIHHPRPYLRAERWRCVNVTGPAPGVGRTIPFRYPHEHREAEVHIQFGRLQAPFEDVVPGAIWTRLAEGDIFTATTAAVELLVEWLERPTPPPPDSAEVRRRFAALHAQFMDYAELDRRFPRPAADLPPHMDWGGRCLLVKVANSFHTPPAREWCGFPMDLAFERMLLSRHHADAEYLIHRNMPSEFPRSCEEAGATLPPALPDRPVMFRRQLAPGAHTLAPGPAALNPDPTARWVRFVFNALRELDPTGGLVEVRFIGPPGVSEVYGSAALPGGFFVASARAIEVAGLLPSPVVNVQGPEGQNPSPTLVEPPADPTAEVQTNSTAEEPPLRAQPAGALVPRCNGRLLCSPDCGVVLRGEEMFTLPPGPRAVIVYMIAAWEVRPRVFTQEELLDQSGSDGDSFRSVFRSGGEMNPAWGGLITQVEGRRGFYSLCVE